MSSAQSSRSWDACKSMDAVVDAVMAGLVAASHAAVGSVDNGTAFQRGNVPTPEIDSLPHRGQFRQPCNLLCSQFLLQVGILHFQKFPANGCRMANIHKRAQQNLLTVSICRNLLAAAGRTLPQQFLDQISSSFFLIHGVTPALQWLWLGRFQSSCRNAGSSADE